MEWNNKSSARQAARSMSETVGPDLIRLWPMLLTFSALASIMVGIVFMLPFVSERIRWESNVFDFMICLLLAIVPFGIGLVISYFGAKRQLPRVLRIEGERIFVEIPQGTKCWALADCRWWLARAASDPLIGMFAPECVVVIIQPSGTLTNRRRREVACGFTTEKCGEWVRLLSELGIPVRRRVASPTRVFMCALCCPILFGTATATTFLLFGRPNMEAFLAGFVGCVVGFASGGMWTAWDNFYTKEGALKMSAKMFLGFGLLGVTVSVGAPYPLIYKLGLFVASGCVGAFVLWRVHRRNVTG